MLVLTRKLGEELVIGETEIRIKVIGVRGSRTLLGITAPPSIRVRRENGPRRGTIAGNPPVSHRPA